MFLPLVDPPDGPAAGPALVVAVRQSQVVLLDGDAPHGGVFLGVLDGRPCWAVDTDGRDDVGEGEAFVDLRALWGAVDDVRWTLAGRAVQLVEWQRTHRFCGRCATATISVPGERARRCPACGLQAFPRLAPAIITLIERDDGHVLLARGAAFPLPMYSCLAGFVEPGETLEEAVRREVLEEVGVRVGELRYWGSQPWPFPHSLMIGFLARWESGDIEVDGVEIVDAGWYAPDALPMIPPGISIARKMIDAWVTGTAPDQGG